VLNETSELLVGFVVPVIERASFKLNHTGEAVNVIDCSGSCHFGSKAVPSDRGSGDLIGIHPAHNVSTHFFHVVRFMVV